MKCLLQLHIPNHWRDMHWERPLVPYWNNVDTFWVSSPFYAFTLETSSNTGPLRKDLQNKNDELLNPSKGEENGSLEVGYNMV